MKIEGLGLPQPPDPKGKKIKDAQRAEQASDKLKQASDSIQLSKSSQKQIESSYIQKIHPRAESETENIKDLSEYRQKTANGYYNSDESREKTSEKLIKSADLEDVVNEYHFSNIARENLAYSAEVRHDKVAEIRQKVSDGYYDNPANFGLIADKLMNHFGV